MGERAYRISIFPSVVVERLREPNVPVVEQKVSTGAMNRQGQSWVWQAQTDCNHHSYLLGSMNMKFESSLPGTEKQ